MDLGGIDDECAERASGLGLTTSQEKGMHGRDPGAAGARVRETFDETVFCISTCFRGLALGLIGRHPAAENAGRRASNER